jgi:hypothetical protein
VRARSASSTSQALTHFGGDAARCRRRCADDAEVRAARYWRVRARRDRVTTKHLTDVSVGISGTPRGRPVSFLGRFDPRPRTAAARRGRLCLMRK